MKKLFYLLALLLLSTLNPQLSAAPLGTAFTYQGRLADGGNSASGSYDLKFTFYDAASDGSVVSSPLTNAATAVSNGLFTVTLDFGADAFNGDARWLEIGVRTNGGGTFTTLIPRNAITPAPYAIYSANAGTAATATTANSVSAAGIVGTVQLAQLPGTILTNNQSGVVLNGTFSGNGAGLTNLPSSVAVVWQTVSGTNQQAQSNKGYLVTDARQTTVTLPTAPNVGDIVGVGGAGAGGWKIAQNAGQYVQAGAFISITNMNSLANWVPRYSAGGGNWWGMASSSDGTKLVACQNGGYIYTSTDSGTNWVQRSSVGGASWYGVASSSDGTKLVACQYGGYIYTSTDSGKNWVQRSSAGGAGWYAVASSADGTKLVAGQSGYLYTSTDSGVSWVQRPSAGGAAWYGVASSADGTKLVACPSGYIYTSTDSGTNWVARTSAGGSTWWGCASSSDGTKLVVGQDGGYIYTSTDSGATWVPRYSAGGGYWRSIASSADGTKLVACQYGGYIYTSADSGATWSLRSSSGNWKGISSSSDGLKIAASQHGGYIYTAEATIRTTTTVGTGGWVTGNANAAIELVYLGSGQFAPLSSVGTLTWQ